MSNDKTRIHFRKWIQDTQGLSDGYCHLLASAIYSPNDRNKANLKRATVLHEHFLKLQQQQEQQQEEEQGAPVWSNVGMIEHVEKLQKQLESNENVISKLNVLMNARTEKIESLQEEIKRHLIADKNNKDKIETLKKHVSSLDEHKFDLGDELEKQDIEISQYKKQIENLLQRIEDRTELVYIRFSDDSAKAYPKTIKFMDMKEQIDASQISSIAVIDVDWSL